MTWLDRQSFLGEESNTVLETRKIAIIGLCGGGSHIVQQLAHIGFRNFVVIDPQRVDETNLNRLVGMTREDAKRKKPTPKVDIAERVIRSVRHEPFVHKVMDLWQTAGDILKSCDVIVGCLDSVRAKDELDAFCHRFMIPYIDIGMDVHKTADGYLIAGQVVLSSPDTPCLRCLGIVTEDALKKEGQKYGQAGGQPQVVWPNGVLASSAVGLVMQLLLPWHSTTTDSAYLEYDGNKHVMVPSNRLAIAARHPCKHYPPNERGDPSFDVRQLKISRKTTGPQSNMLAKIIAFVSCRLCH